MSNHNRSARHGNRVVWEVARAPDDVNLTKPYRTCRDVGPPALTHT
jgi:hypothetical protein